MKKQTSNGILNFFTRSDNYYKMKKSIILKIAFIIFDILIINAVFILSFYMRFTGNIPSFNYLPYLRTWYIITFFFILIFYFSGVYNKEEFSIDFFFDFFNAANFSYLCVILFYYILREKIGSFPSTVFLISWFFNILFLSIIRVIVFRIIFKKNVLIIGRNKRAKTVAGMIRKKPYNFVGFENVNININNMLKKIMSKKIQLVIITQSISPEKQFYVLLDKLTSLGIRILFDISIVNSPIIKTKIYNLGGMIFYEILWGKLRILQVFLKRNFDIAVSFMFLISLFPLFLLIMLLIKLDSKGNIFFKQERVGKNYRKFTIYKFRTMIKNAEEKVGPVWASVKDKRVTKIGRILRKSGIDELPQLWNIFKGDMSFIGPRPERKYFIKKYPVLLSRRLSVKPGLTGLAQMNSINLNPYEKTKYDIAYVENQSFLLDLIIIKKTLTLLFKRLFNE